MPTCYQLIGVPGSGKTTWVNSQNWTKNCTYVSTDHYVEKFARRMGKTYSEVFEQVMPRAVGLMTNQVIRARSAGRDIIWDQTSVNVKSRKNKFRMLPNYDHVAIVFDTPNSEELNRRLASRPGKHIPQSVMISMIRSFKEPDLNEGFKEIWRV